MKLFVTILLNRGILKAWVPTRVLLHCFSQTYTISYGPYHIVHMIWSIWNEWFRELRKRCSVIRSKNLQSRSKFKIEQGYNKNAQTSSKGTKTWYGWQNHEGYSTYSWHICRLPIRSGHQIMIEGINRCSNGTHLIITVKDTQRALSKYAYYEVIESGRIVMKKGDRPLRFHIIVSGIGHEHILTRTRKLLRSTFW